MTNLIQSKLSTNIVKALLLLSLGTGSTFFVQSATMAQTKPVPEKASPAAAKQKAPSSTEALMQDKLRSAQSILRGLALEDFQGIKKDTEMLKMVAKAASWHNSESPEYMRYFKNFEESVDFLAQHAVNKNLEGIAMGYVRLTLTCMQCHNFVREQRPRK